MIDSDLEIETNRATLTIPKWFVLLFPILFVPPGVWAWRVDRALVRIEMKQDEMTKFETMLVNQNKRINELEKNWASLGGPNDPLYSELKATRDEIADVKSFVGFRRR